MAAPNFSSHIAFNGIPAAWVIPITYESGATEITIDATATATRLLLDNFKTPKIKFIRPEGGATATEEFVDITRCDGTIIRLNKEGLILNPDGSVKSSSSGGGVVKGQISLINNQADKDSASYYDYMAKLQALMTGAALVCMPFGWNYDNRNTATSLGFAYIIGTLDADVEHAIDGFAPAAHTLSFTSLNIGVGTLEEPADGVDLPVIKVPRGLSSGSVTGPDINPAAITLEDVQTLATGAILLKAA